MGMIIDPDLPAATSIPVRRAAGGRRAPRIESDTPIVPHAVAAAVWSEACVWLGEELPRDWVGELAQRADAVYANNLRFRRNLRSQGNRGRDWLWAFTRHWLCALILKHRPALHRRLPAAYNTGSELPPGTPQRGWA